tara:strand:- start:24 stop:392 length:369 start_codon:yes stop_codon:yes gene_type:complete
MRYGDIVEQVCGSSWRNTEAEKDGGYGVACMVAFLRGTNPSLRDLAAHLEVEPRRIKKAFIKMSSTGLFTDKFGARDNKELLGRGVSNSVQHMNCWTSDDAYRAAWCQVAAIASGFITRSYR